MPPAIRYKLSAIRHWPEIVAALAPILVFWRLVFGGQVLYWGLPSLQFVPWRVLVNDALRAGHLPLWTPLLGMGAPLMANHQSAVFYPPNWLSLIIPPEYAVSILAVLHLSFAGVGMVRLARRTGLGDFGAAIAGLTFGLSGYLTGRLWFITINNAMVWLPWIVAASTPPLFGAVPNGGGAGGGGRGVRLSALIALQLLAGHAQSSFYTLLIAGAWVVWWSWKRETLRALSQFGLAVLFALCLTAVQLIPTIELLRESPRAAAAEYEFATTYSFWPWRLITLVAPNFFGHPADHTYWGYASYWEDNAYLGVLPLLFAGVAVLTYFFNHREHGEHREDKNKDSVFSMNSVVNFLCVTAILSLLLALGKNTPVFPFIYHYVPGFNLFQAPARMLIGLTFAVSLLAGIGAEAWTASARKRYWARLGIAGSVTALAVGIAGAWIMGSPRPVTLASGLAGAALFGVGAFITILIQPDSPTRWRWLALAFVTVDLGLAAARLNPTASADLYHLRPALTLSAGRAYMYADDEYAIKFREFFRFNSFDALEAQSLRDSLLPNLPVLGGIPSANNFDPLLPARYVEYVKAMESNPRLLDLADVREIVKPMGIVTARDSDTARVRMLYNARAVGNAAAALAAITDPDFDPDSETILESTPPSPFGRGVGGEGENITVTLDRDGFVVLSDTYYPGWRVYVDGEPRPLLRADYLFRAVAVPAGQHTVTFEYAPLSVTVGLVISVIAVFIWIGIFFSPQRTQSTRRSI